MWTENKIWSRWFSTVPCYAENFILTLICTWHLLTGWYISDLTLDTNGNWNFCPTMAPRLVSQCWRNWCQISSQIFDIRKWSKCAEINEHEARTEGRRSITFHLYHHNQPHINTMNPSHFCVLRRKWLTTSLQQTLVWHKLSPPGCIHLTTISSMPGYKPSCYSGTKF